MTKIVYTDEELARLGEFAGQAVWDEWIAASWMIMWSPTALTQAVLLTPFPMAQTSVVMPLGIGATIAMIRIGRAMDRLFWRGLAPATPVQALAFPKQSALGFA